MIARYNGILTSKEMTRSVGSYTSTLHLWENELLAAGEKQEDCCGLLISLVSSSSNLCPRFFWQLTEFYSVSSVEAALQISFKESNFEDSDSIPVTWKTYSDCSLCIFISWLHEFVCGSGWGECVYDRMPWLIFMDPA